MIEPSATFLGKNGFDNNTTMSYQYASTECQQLIAWLLGKSQDCAVTLNDNHTIGRLSMQTWLRQHRCYVLNMIVNGA